ncbi:hypothetical protein [Ruegeria atlantica]|nr:hypothetical protein [Ruegeria atlantica]
MITHINSGVRPILRYSQVFYANTNNVDLYQIDIIFSFLERVNAGLQG